MQAYALTAQDQRSALERAVFISLFTWRRADPGDQVDGADLQGWWGDSYPSLANDRIGSKLWLLRRRTITPQTLRDAQRYCEEALQWLVDDGHVTQVTVTITRPAPTRLSAQVLLQRHDGDPLPLSFDDLLQLQVSHVISHP
ncbi:phage GP46 family protein [Comamonas aquatica]|uniref:Phage GP46 family protein n=1 Tax=Comamonas aquatica TaxID=225991 RepID=A0AA42HQQ6_9BURK|nr:phage GP46 family protein [Comamonas aquatica]MDH0362785.1 phage GP46 family protein [Comamonas aquatica]